MVTPSYVKKQSLWLKGKMLHGNLEQNCQQAMVEGADPASLFNCLTSAPELQHPPGEAKLVPAKPLAITAVRPVSIAKMCPKKQLPLRWVNATYGSTPESSQAAGVPAPNMHQPGEGGLGVGLQLIWRNRAGVGVPQWLL